MSRILPVAEAAKHPCELFLAHATSLLWRTTKEPLHRGHKPAVSNSRTTLRPETWKNHALDAMLIAKSLEILDKLPKTYHPQPQRLILLHE
ncbi:hypothetical protein Ae201684_015886 [Aphanomyces euteiches]|uniref:Uncharacterized protein n=1 Tax=Aphanomyces euteiches TaxID=100861 RepID=A0A6G0WG55_9STRA|nr:hypothetical protein Ae201684_015886 [Aphanomyces euteiches]